MSRTTTRPQRPHATGYAVHPYADALLAEPEHDAGAMAPAGQLWTTVADLAAFARFLAGDCAAAARAGDAGRDARAGRDQRPEPASRGRRATGSACSCGTPAGTRYYGHTGSMPGFVAVLQVTDAPGADTAIVLCNSTTGFSRSLGTDLLGILADGEPYCPPEWTPARVSDDLLDMLGSWYWGPAPFTLRLDGDVLELRRQDGDGRAMRFRPRWRRRLDRHRRLPGRRAAGPCHRAGRLGERAGRRLVHLHQDAVRPGRAGPRRDRPRRLAGGPGRAIGVTPGGGPPGAGGPPQAVRPLVPAVGALVRPGPAAGCRSAT